MIRALIADDEPLARRKIKNLLAREPDVEVAAECGSGPEAAKLIRELDPNLVFLDIEMPELDGLSLLKGLGGHTPPAVIFVTAYDRYAVGAFDAQALDYLLKPIDRRRFQTALERAREHLGKRGERSAGPLTRLLVRSGDRTQVLKVDDVDWVESADNYVKLHALGQTHLLRETLAHLRARLDPARFVRIHRSAVVNVDRIQSLYPLFHGDQMLVLRDGTELPLSRRYRQELENLLGRPARP
jgi:two-component system, LytTR family, response regulator